MTPTKPTSRPISQALLAAALVGAAAWLSFRAGGYFHAPRTGLAVAAWLAVALVAAVPGRLALLPPTVAGRLAVGGLLALAAWTALSLLWAPLAESGREDAIRLALYAAALALAVAALRAREVARAVEVALAALALAVVGYGVLGKLGTIDTTDSLRADGRLDQPLSYWNGMGAMAALGLVLCIRLAVDATRPAALRLGGAIATAPLAAGLYLTYSRGALLATALGLVALALLVPEAQPLWRRAGRRWRLAAGWGTIVAVAGALVVVAGDRAAPPAVGATPERFADIGSNRADYWRVAVGAFADRPLTGLGTAGFQVEWLRERDVLEGVADAHSLYLETAAELGVVGLLALLAFAGGTAACARELVRRDPALAAGPSAALALLAFHAGIDWDWELPALALPALALAGLAIANASAAQTTSPLPVGQARSRVRALRRSRGAG